MSLTGIVSTIEPTLLTDTLSTIDLEPIPKYVPPPTAASMDDSISGKTIQYIQSLLLLYIILVLHTVVNDFWKINLKDEYQVIQLDELMTNKDCENYMVTYPHCQIMNCHWLDKYSYCLKLHNLDSWLN